MSVVFERSSTTIKKKKWNIERKSKTVSLLNSLPSRDSLSKPFWFMESLFWKNHAIWVQRLLTPLQKQMRVECSCVFFEICRKTRIFFCEWHNLNWLFWTWSQTRVIAMAKKMHSNTQEGKGDRIFYWTILLSPSS